MIITLYTSKQKYVQTNYIIYIACDNIHKIFKHLVDKSGLLPFWGLGFEPGEVAALRLFVLSQGYCRQLLLASKIKRIAASVSVAANAHRRFFLEGGGVGELLVIQR